MKKKSNSKKVVAKIKKIACKKAIIELSKIGARRDEELREMGFLVGTASDFKRQIEEYGNAGAQRVMIQWVDLDDLEGLRRLAVGVLG